MASFKSRQEAGDLGKLLGFTLGLKAEDLADTDANDPDLTDDLKV